MRFRKRGDTDEFIPIVRQRVPVSAWQWPTRGHKVRSAGDRRPQAMRWNRVLGQWTP